MLQKLGCQRCLQFQQFDILNIDHKLSKVHWVIKVSQFFKLLVLNRVNVLFAVVVVKLMQKVVEAILWDGFLWDGLGISSFTGLNSTFWDLLWLLLKILLVIWLILIFKVLLWLLDLILRLFFLFHRLCWWFFWDLSRPHWVSDLFYWSLFLLFIYFLLFLR